MNDWLSEYETILRPYLPGLSHETALRADDQLADLGLDSMGTVSLLMDLEDAFAISLPDDLLTKETFTTPATIRAAVETLHGRPLP